MADDCRHDLDPEYLHPRDVDVLALEADGDDLLVRFALPCPECDQALELEAPVRSVEESSLTLPVDADEIYD